MFNSDQVNTDVLACNQTTTITNKQQQQQNIWGHTDNPNSFCSYPISIHI